MEELNEKSFDEFIKRNEKCLIDFYSNWCPPCLALALVLPEIQKELNIPIGKVNIDDCPGLARRFGIVAIPTLILFKDGKEVKRIIGFKNKQTLMEELKD